jgi:hypothetical protein
MIRNEQPTGFDQRERWAFTVKRINRVLLASLIIGAVVFCARPSSASDDDIIDTVSSDGEHIIMQSGQVYQSDDPGTSSSWQSGDDVVVTPDDTIINRDEGGESVDGAEE